MPIYFSFLPMNGSEFIFFILQQCDVSFYISLLTSAKEACMKEWNGQRDKPICWSKPVPWQKGEDTVRALPNSIHELKNMCLN